MRKKSLLVAGLAISLLATMSMGMISCSKDDPKPDVVENPLDAEVYYIIGKVSQGTTALEGVKVSAGGSEATTAADGTFQLEVTKKGDYAVAFAKDGYISVSANATIASDAAKRSSVAVLQELTKANAPVTVEPDKEATVSGGEESAASLDIPAGAVKTATDITVTEYVAGAQKEATHASLSTINCQPDGLTFEKPVKVSVKNQTSSTIYFADVVHYVEKNGSWTKSGDAAYDASANAYVTELTSFSNHSFGPSYTAASKGSSSEDLGEVTIDNLGNMSAKDGEIKAKQKMGWTIDGDLSALLKAQFPALTSADIESLVASINSAIASTKGASAGISESTVSMGTAKVSGDTKMTVKLSASVRQTAGTFNFMYQGKPVSFSVPVKTYSGVATQITYQYGSSHTDHSGGTGK